MGTIHIALPCYDPKGTYAKHVAVVMASVLDNTTANVIFYIMHDETLTDDNRTRFEQLKKTVKAEVRFLNMSGYFINSSENLSESCSIYSKGALFRLLLPEVLPELDKIIYLDADIVVTLDIAKLWEINIENNSFAAVLDPVAEQSWILTKQEKENFQRLGIDKNNYFCAGVLVMNLTKLRQENKIKGTLLNRIIEYFKKYKLKYPDQDFLNCEYCDDVFFLDTCFNYMQLGASDNVTDPKIWHFGISFKPWINFSSPASALYWKYLLRTPWKDEWCNMLYEAATGNEFYHRHSSACIKRLLTKFLPKK